MQGVIGKKLCVSPTFYHRAENLRKLRPGFDGNRKQPFDAAPAASAGVGVSDITDTQNVIHAGLVKPGQPDQDLGGDIVLSGFIFGIAGLGHPQIPGNLRLIEIRVLPQITQSVHLASPGLVSHIRNKSIAF